MKKLKIKKLIQEKNQKNTYLKQKKNINLLIIIYVIKKEKGAKIYGIFIKKQNLRIKKMKLN